MKTGIQLIADERQEQIEKHGFDVAHDMYYADNQLLRAAMFCINPETAEWPMGWDNHFRSKIISKSRVEQLTVAGAFLAAHIDRLQYQRITDANDHSKYDAE